uniref:alanine--tRNA ligase n=1 Tax=Inquilinus sp. TaxID=1932117 RepID=UPI0037842505
QGKHDNYDIDLMRALIEASADATNTDPDGPFKISHRVIADHLRATSFLMADGVMPSNEGRGYVLRRIMRRAMRHAHLIGARDPVMYKLVPALVRQMGAAYPELVRAEALITETLKLEESRFKQTLERGLRLLEDETGRLGGGQALPGEVAFKLYDTYGFPLDLTQDVLRGQGRTVDTAGFDTAMERQRAEARKNWAGSGEAATGAVWFELKEKLEPTEFLGYDTEAAEGVVTALVVDGKVVDQAGPGAEVVVVVNQTPFYGESGGQMGDAGTITLAAGGAGGVTVAVRDTQKQAGVLWAHIGTVESGTLKVGDAVELKVDHGRRGAIRANHSATHLLHAALRRRLGEHVTQKGSLVAPERLRFDVSQPRPLTPEDIAVVEAEVNARIRENAEVTTRLMTPEDAIAAGAMALFGEKYGDTVRVVGMGQDGNKVYSQELCGGTHVGRTGDIGAFRLVSEGAVAAGIRRIEAVTGEAAVAYAAHRDTLLADAASALKVTPDELPARLAALVEERRRLEREVSDLRRKLATAGSGGGAGPEVKEIAGIKFSGRILDDLPARELKPMADALKQQLGSGVVALVGRAEGKLSVCIGVTEDLTGRFDAVALVRAAAEAAGGKGGGGRPDMAQAGGPDAARAGEALAAVEAALAA